MLKVKNAFPAVKFSKMEVTGAVDEDDMVFVNIKFRGSAEGLGIAIEPNTIFIPYDSYLGKKKNFVELGVVKKGFHYMINPWPYSTMKKEELAEMKKVTSFLIKTLPDAVLVFEDDGSVDYNVNTVTPQHKKNYTVVASSPSEWKEKFSFEED